MPLLLNLLLSLAFAGAVAGAFHVWRVQFETSRRDGMQALAARRGWALTVTGERLGRAGTLRLVPRGGLPWIAETRPPSRAGRPAVTEYEAEEPRWAGGTLILIAAAPHPHTAGGPKPDEAALRELLGDDLARVAAVLGQVAAPEGVTALADADPRRRAMLDDLGRALRGWSPVAPGPQGLPVLVLSPEGMRLRLRRPLRRPDQMERFLDLAFDLSRLIGP